MFSSQIHGSHLPASSAPKPQTSPVIKSKRPLTAKVLDAGFHDPPNGGWIKLSWEMPNIGKRKGTSFVTRYIQCSRVRAAQEMARLARL